MSPEKEIGCAIIYIIKILDKIFEKNIAIPKVIQPSKNNIPEKINEILCTIILQSNINQHAIYKAMLHNAGLGLKHAKRNKGNN